jgi:hypothetical protein
LSKKGFLLGILLRLFVKPPRFIKYASKLWEKSSLGFVFA